MITFVVEAGENKLTNFILETKQKTLFSLLLIYIKIKIIIINSISIVILIFITRSVEVPNNKLL